MNGLELAVILVVVAVVVVLVLRLAWEHIRHLVRRGDRYEPLGEEPVVTVAPAPGFEPGTTGLAMHLRSGEFERYVVPPRRREAFAWPQGRAERREGDRELGVPRGW